MGVCVYVCEAGDLFVHVYVYCKYMCLCLFRAYGMYLFEDVFVGLFCLYAFRFSSCFYTIMGVPSYMNK